MTQTYTIKSRHPDGYEEIRNDVLEENVNRFIATAETNLYTVLSVEKNEPMSAKEIAESTIEKWPDWKKAYVDRYREIRHLSSADRRDVFAFAMQRSDEMNKEAD